MAWNGSNGAGQPANGRANRPAGRGERPARPHKAQGVKHGFLAFLIIVALGGAALWFFTRPVPPAPAPKEPKNPAAVKSEPIAAPTPKKQPVAPVAIKPPKLTKSEPDTNIVWVGRMRYIKKMANGKSVMVYTDDPNNPKPVPIFKQGLNNFLTNFTTPGEDIPETPMEITDEQVKAALEEKIEINHDDSDEVKYQKESVALLREGLAAYIKEGRTPAEFIHDIQRRQQLEAAQVREARSMIMESLSKDNPSEARQLYEAINKHMNDKGLPKVRLPRKFLKMMEVEE